MLLLDASALRTDSPLIRAAYRGSLATVRLLLRAGANVRACDSAALCMAAAGGHTEVMAELLAHGASPDARTADGNGVYYNTLYWFVESSKAQSSDHIDAMEVAAMALIRAGVAVENEN